MDSSLRRSRLASTAVLAIGVAAILTASGCASGSHTAGVARADGQPAVVVELMRTTVGYSHRRRGIELVEFGSGPHTVLIMGGIHGEEPASARLVELLDDRLSEGAITVSGEMTVVLMPRVNPDGLAVNRRTNERGVDLNRNFPAENFDGSAKHGSRALSEPESRAVHEVISEYLPEVIISVHQPLNCVDYDGGEEARRLAQRIARASSMKVRKLGTRPGSLGAFAGEDLQIPVITLELPGSATMMGDDELWERYGAALLEVIR